MLVLSRKVGEVVRIGDDTEVVLLSIHGGHVRLGFKAPKDKVIHRHEIIKKIEQEFKNQDNE